MRFENTAGPQRGLLLLSERESTPPISPIDGGRRQEPCDVNFRRRLRGDRFLFAEPSRIYLVARAALGTTSPQLHDRLLEPRCQLGLSGCGHPFDSSQSSII